MNVIEANLEHVEPLARLFDQYRVFYEQASDVDGARRFLTERLERGQSHVLCAEEDGVLHGFTQLYPSFSSVGMRPLWILNDLFVAPSMRRRGVGRLLLEAARRHATAAGAGALILETQATNTAAQSLYESLGWRRLDGFFHYQIDACPT